DGAHGGAALAHPWLLQAQGAATGDVVLLAHEAPGLGTYAFSAMRGGDTVATCYPLAPDAVVAARDALRAQVGAARDAPFARTQALPGA
ncbi:MAG TPA: hypothetical protein VFL14_00175, partial [Xanthomonadales bacterium]|nr:hypothetical protein [Xanthomonadales bacterium]